jgi:hypothetical protein
MFYEPRNFSSVHWGMANGLCYMVDLNPERKKEPRNFSSVHWSGIG